MTKHRNDKISKRQNIEIILYRNGKMSKNNNRKIIVSKI